MPGSSPLESSPTRRGRTRAETRENTRTQIHAAARRHLATHGAAGLSLRAIAREIGLVSSAVYRYVPSRDHLLTELLVEGYTDLAAAVTDALAVVPADDHLTRIRCIAMAMRTWAVGDPARWALLYGSPVPGFAAPRRTVEPGTRVMAIILTEIHRAERSKVKFALVHKHFQPLSDDFTSIRSEFGVDIGNTAILMATTLWANIIGGISLEVFGQYGTDTFSAPASLFEAHITAMLQAFTADEGHRGT